MILRNYSSRMPILAVLAMTLTMSFFGLYYAYSSYGLPQSIASQISSPAAPSDGGSSSPSAGKEGADVSSPEAPVGDRPDLGDGSHQYEPVEGADEDTEEAGDKGKGKDKSKGEGENKGENKDADKDSHSIVAKVSVAANKLDNDMIHRALLTHQTQNDRHGYHHYIATEEAVSDLIENDAKHRPKGAWTKPAYMLSIVIAELEKPEEERIKWLFWFDADTIVLNPETPLEVFLPPDDDPELESINLMMPSNWDGLNSGAFAVRVSPWTASMLSAVLAYPIYKAEKMEKDRFRDQSAFQWLLEDEGSPLTQTPTKGREHYAVPPMRWFNSLPVNNAFDKNKDGIGWLFGHKMEGPLFDNGTDQVYDDGQGGEVRPWKVMQGDMIVHFAGSTAGGTRDSWMGPWLDRCEALLPEWADPDAQHALRDEVLAFWDRTVKRLKRERTEAKQGEVPLPDDQKVKPRWWRG